MVGVTVSFVHFSSCQFLPVKVRYQKWVFMLYFFLKVVLFKKIQYCPLKGSHRKYEAVSASYISPLCILSRIRVKLALHFSLKDKIIKNYLYLSKLEAQMVILTPSENLSLQLYEAQNKNFNCGTTKTLILHTRSNFFQFIS